MVNLHLEHKSQLLEGLMGSIKGVQEAASCDLHAQGHEGVELFVPSHCAEQPAAIPGNELVLFQLKAMQCNTHWGY